MDQWTIELVKNFARCERPAEAAAQALNIPLAEVLKVYKQFQEHREMFKRTISRLRAATLLLLLLVPVGRAQTISPVIEEVGAKGTKPITGNFTITNGMLIPITVVVEPPQRFVGLNGQPINFQPTDGTWSLELSEQSARIGAHQQHQFFYKLWCATKPCAVKIIAVITGPHTREGIAVAIRLPHVIYLCQKQKGCRASVLAGRQP